MNTNLENKLPISDFLSFEQIEKEYLKNCAIDSKTLEIYFEGKKLPSKLKRIKKAKYKVI